MIFQLFGLRNRTSVVLLQCFFLSLDPESNSGANKTMYGDLALKMATLLIMFSVLQISNK